MHPRLDVATGRWTVPSRARRRARGACYADFAADRRSRAVAEADLMVAGDFAPEELGPDRRRRASTATRCTSAASVTAGEERW